ncbi:MAG: M10 family metallopeptidase C-terminal domain-containing protein [Lentisphaeria bacterium]|nr:M10 family metallopeptidase C-terminal domain-containing protein [Lentisphaeria bacterium]
MYTGDDGRVDGDENKGVIVNLSASAIDFTTENIWADGPEWLDFNFDFSFGQAAAVTGSRLAGFDEIFTTLLGAPDSGDWADPRNWAVANARGIVGTDAEDQLTGNAFDNLILGMGGADTIDGAGGTDIFSLSGVSAEAVINLTESNAYTLGTASGISSSGVWDTTADVSSNYFNKVATLDFSNLDLLDDDDWTITLDGTPFAITDLVIAETDTVDGLLGEIKAAIEAASLGFTVNVASGVITISHASNFAVVHSVSNVNYTKNAYASGDLTGSDYLRFDIDGVLHTIVNPQDLNILKTNLDAAQLGFQAIINTSGDLVIVHANAVTVALEELDEDGTVTTLANIEGVEGGSGDDLIIGSSNDDIFYFSGEFADIGNDTLADFSDTDKLDFTQLTLNGEAILPGDLTIEKLENQNVVRISLKDSPANYIVIHTDISQEAIEDAINYNTGGSKQALLNDISSWFGGNDGSSPQRVDALGSTPSTLSQGDLDAVVQQAMDDWYLGDLLADLVQFKIADLSSFEIPDGENYLVQDETNGYLLAIDLGTTILIDDDAAGYGWHADPGTAPAAGAMDLISTIKHEIGNILGMADDETPSDNVMTPFLEVATRTTADLSMLDNAFGGSEITDLASGLTTAKTFLNEFDTEINSLLEYELPFTGLTIGGALDIGVDIGSAIADEMDALIAALDGQSNSTDLFGLGQLSFNSLDNLNEFKATLNLVSFSDSFELDASTFNIEALEDAGIDIGSLLSFNDVVNFDMEGAVVLEFVFGLDDSDNFFLENPKLKVDLSFGEQSLDVFAVNHAGHAITLTGDQTDLFAAGKTYTVSGSSENNDGNVTVLKIEFDAGTTTLWTVETLDASSTGTISALELSIVNVDDSTDQITVDGDQTASILSGASSLSISGSTGNDASYDINTVVYDEVLDITIITLLSSPTLDETSDGNIVIGFDISSTLTDGDYADLEGYYIDEYSVGESVYFGGSELNKGVLTIAAISYDQKTNLTRLFFEEALGSSGDEGRLRKTFDMNVSIGFIDADLDNAAVGFHAGLSLGADVSLNTGDLTAGKFSEIFGGVDFDIAGDFDVYLPIEINTPFAGLEIAPIVLEASSPALTSVSSLPAFLGSLASLIPSNLDITELIKFKALSLEDLLNALEWSLDELISTQSAEVPLLGMTYEDLLTFDGHNILIEIRDAIAALRGAIDNIDEFETSINDEIRNVLNTVLGAGTVTEDLLYINYSDSVFEFGIDLEQIFEKTIALDFSLADWVDDIDSPTLTELVDLADSLGIEADLLLGDLDLYAAFDFELGFGVDLTNIAAPTIYMEDTSGISIDISASLSDISAYFEIFGLGMFGDGGEIIIDLNLGLEIADDLEGDGRIDLFAVSGAMGSAADAVEMELFVDGVASIELPLYFPLRSMPVGGTTEDINGDGIAENSLYMNASFSLDDGFDYNYSIPDFSMDFDIVSALIAAMDDPNNVIGALESFFDGVDEVAGGFANIELPLIGGDAFDSLADSLYDLRENVLGRESAGVYLSGGLGYTIQEIALPSLTTTEGSIDRLDKSYMLTADGTADIVLGDGSQDINVNFSEMADDTEKQNAIAAAVKTLTGFQTQVSGTGGAWAITVDASFFDAALNAIREGLYTAFISLNEGGNATLFAFVIPSLDADGFKQYDGTGKLITEILNATDHTADDI